jgi:hypothetical protein
MTGDCVIIAAGWVSAWVFQISAPVASSIAMTFAPL